MLKNGCINIVLSLQCLKRMLNISSQMSAQMQISLLGEGGLDLHTGLSSAYSSKPTDGQCMGKKQEFEKEEESSVTTQCEDKDVNANVLQNKNRNGSKRVYECPVCHKRFGAPSKLKRHCFIHTDQRPFQCSICFRAFRERSHLKAHFRTHTNPSSPDAVTTAGKGNYPYTKHTNNCRPDGGNVCLLQILDSLENKKHENPECQSKLNQNVQLIESNSSTLEIKSSDTLKDAEVQITTSSPIDLKHTHKGVNQCSICLKNFPYPSKLARHILSHTDIRPFKCHVCLKSFKFRWHLQCHVRIHKKKGETIIVDHLEQDCTVSFSNAVKSEQQDVQISSQDGSEDFAIVHQDQNTVKENMMNHKMSGDCRDSAVYLQVSLLNEERLDPPTKRSSAYSPKPSEGQWMEENLENEEKQESSVTTQSEDNEVNVNVSQSKNFNGNESVYDCPVCHKRFGAPSKLKRHCLIHTNQRPFQCSTCCRAFRECSHLKVHIRTHTNPVKRRTRSLHSYKDNSVPCNRTFKSRLKPSPKYLTVRNNVSSTKKHQSTVHQDENMLTENVVSQFNSGDCSESDAYLQDSLLHKEDLDLHIGLSSAYSSNPAEGQWMEEIQESEEEQEASVTTQTEDNDVNSKVWQSENSNGSKKVYDCPVCHKRFGAPSKLKRHCLIHTNQRPFQCSICCRAFRERSHLKVHFRTHNIPEKRKPPSHQSYRDNSVSCNRASKLKPSPKQPTAQGHTKSTDKEKSTVHQDENMLTENVVSQIKSGDISESGTYLLDSLLNKEDLNLHTGLTSAYSPKTSEEQWMEENLETEEKQESSVTTQSEDNYVNVKVLQSKNFDGNKIVYDCPVCHKRFGAPSKLKRHCLIHTNQRPFQCSTCCRAFRERSHLKVHIRTHTNLVKRWTRSLHSYKDNSVPSNRTSKSRLKPSPKYLTIQNLVSSTEKHQSTVHQDENMVTEKVASQIISGDCSESDAYLQDYPLNKECVDHHTGFGSAYSSNPSEGQWMEKIQEASVTTHIEDSDVNSKVWQSKIFNGTSRIYDCPVCNKQFAAPSKLKRHCLIHTNQRPFQCSTCCRAFRECSHLKVHFRTHNIPEKRKTPSHQSYRDNSVSCNQASRLKPSPKQPTAQGHTKSTDKEKSTVHQEENMVTENVVSQINSGDCSESDAYLLDSLLNKEDLNLHTGLSSAYSPKTSEDQWMEENLETEEKQESSVTTQSEDNYVNVKVLQSTNFDGNKIVYDCPVCHKRFGTPSKLKRHCLIHTNQRPFQCSTCCRAFRERSHLKVHIRTHTNPLKRRRRSLHSCKDNSVPCNRTSKSRLKPSPKYLTVQNNASSTEIYQSTVHQDENMVTENVVSQINSGDCSESDAYLQDSLLNKEDLDLHIGLSSAYSSNPAEGQWMEEIQESEEEQEASVTTQTEDNDVNSKVWQSKNSNGSKRVYDCPVCHKRFRAPCKLKRHCLIHTNQRLFQCSICCRAFRERSHLKVHFRTHNIPEKRKTPSHQSYRDNSVSCNRASRLKPSPKQPTAQGHTKSTDKEKSTVHQEENMVTENVASQIINGDCSESDAHLQDSLLNKGLDLHTGLSSAYISNRSEGQWMEEIRESEEEQEASVTTQSEDNYVNSKVWQSKNIDGNKIVYDCPVCNKRFVAPSKLKRHCLIHTNQRPFQCSTCCRAFRERSHLKVHFRTHNIPEKRKTPSHQSYRDNIVSCNRASRLKPSPKQPTAQGHTKSTDKEKSTVHQEQNMVTENVASQIISGDCSESDAHLQDSLLNKEYLDIHTELSSAYSPKPSEDQWMEENLETVEKQESSVTTQTEDNNVNLKVLQSTNFDGNKIVYDCPVCHKRFGTPSKLKRHCLIHTNQRPFQCSTCCRAFRKRSHLKVHIRTHTNPVKRRTRSLHSYKDNSVPCNRTSKSRLKPSPKYLTVQNNASSTEKHQSTVHKDENMVTENVVSQINSGDCSESDAYLQDSLLNKEDMDLHIGLSSAYSSNPAEGQWMEEIQESEEEQEASVTTHTEGNDVNSKVWQSKYSNGSKRVYDCPVCNKRFGAPSKLKRHCLIHTNQRPFQCSTCCRAFREHSHLKVRFRTHNIPEKRKTPSHQSYRDNSVSCNRASRLKPSPKQPTAQGHTKSTDKEKSTVHQDENVVTENVASQIISGDCSESDAYLQDSLLNKGLDLHTGLSSAYISNHSEGQWMEEIRESEEEQEASVTTQSEDSDVNSKVWQSKIFNGSSRIYDCPVCNKQFAAPSKLKRHCLIHTNQRPFQCSTCCRAFRERSHLKVHIRTHTNPVKRRTRSLHSYKDNSVPSNRTSKSRLKPSRKYLTVQNNASSTEKHQSTVHQDENMVTENVVSQINSGDCSESDAYLQDTHLNKEDVDLHTGLSSAYSSNPAEGQWMEEIQESEEEQEASVTTQSEDNYVSSKVWQSKNSNGSKRVYDCPVCHKRFGAPSKLKQHCLIHTNQRLFQCSICCRAFRERSHLKVHFRTHNIPEKRKTPSHQSYGDNSVSCNRASRLKPSPKQPTAQGHTKSTDKEKSTVHQEENMVTENVVSQIISGDCSESDAYLKDSLLNTGLDLHTGLSSAYSSNPSEGQWMEEIQESEEEQESSVTTQIEDNDVNSKVWQSKNSNGSKRVYDCPVCHKRFGAPSKIKRHCLIHTNQRPFQCSICCSAFRERSHLKVHFRTHNIPEKRRTPSHQSYRDNSAPYNRSSKSRLKPSPKCLTAHNETTSTNKQKSTVQQDRNVLSEDMLSQKISGGCSDSGVYLSKSASPLENVENKIIFWCNNQSVWGLTHKNDILLDGKMASDIVPLGRVSDCPPKTDSSLRHCPPESRTEEKLAHHMDDIEECVFVDSDTVVTLCVPDSYEPSSCHYQQKPDVPRFPEVVVELEDFEDPGECFIKPPHDLPFCPDCNQSFRTIRNLYAHNCAHRYHEREMKKSHRCDICFKFFNAPSKLKRHYVIHTGQRSFQCTQCQKLFTQSHHLKTHMLSHK